MGIEEQGDEQAFDGTRVHGDLAVAIGRVARRVFQPIQRALATQRRTVGTARLQPIREQRQNRIETQVVVVDDVLIAEREADDPLADQGAERMYHPARIAPVPEARRGPIDQADGTIRRPQQQRPGIRRHRPAVERCFDTAAIEPFETELLRDTLCPHRTPHSNLTSLSFKTTFSDSRGRCTYPGEICGLGDLCAGGWTCRYVSDSMWLSWF